MKHINSNLSLKKLVFVSKYYLLIGLVLLIINKTATMLIPSMGKYLIDDVINNNDVNLLKNIMIIIVVSLIIQATSSFLLTHILSIKAQQRIVELRTQFFHKLTLLPLSFFKEHSSGEITSRVLSDFDSIRIILGTGLVQLVGGILSILLSLILMMLLNVKLTFYILSPVGFFCVILYFFYKRQKPSFKIRKQTRANVASSLTEAFRGIKVVKGFESNDYTTSFIKKDFVELFNAIKQTLIATNLMTSLGIVLMGIVSLLVMWFGSHMVINKELTIGELTTFTMYLGFMIVPIYQITKIYSQFTDAGASINRINEVFNLENESDNGRDKDVEVTGSIQFDNVCFSYENNPVFNNLSFVIEPNTINAIIGKSGAGKTTIIDLLAAFSNPDSGQILVDNQPLSSINVHAYRKQLGFVFEETYLFNVSIKENILLAKPNANEQELKMAMINANVVEFITGLPKGEDTVIGENGIKLSSGQRQRIAIARAFLSNPKILILDEVTSNLDAYNEALITESISKLMENRTIIIVAHRLNTIVDANQILLLENGRIVERGTHSQLMNLQKGYASLYNDLNE